MNELIQTTCIQLWPSKRRMAVVYDKSAMQAIAGGFRDIGPGSGGQGKLIDKSPINTRKEMNGEQQDSNSSIHLVLKGQYVV